MRCPRCSSKNLKYPDDWDEKNYPVFVECTDCTEWFWDKGDEVE